MNTTLMLSDDGTLALTVKKGRELATRTVANSFLVRSQAHCERSHWPAIKSKDETNATLTVSWALAHQ